MLHVEELFLKKSTYLKCCLSEVNGFILNTLYVKGLIFVGWTVQIKLWTLFPWNGKEESQWKQEQGSKK